MRNTLNVGEVRVESTGNLNSDHDSAGSRLAPETKAVDR